MALFNKKETPRVPDLPPRADLPGEFKERGLPSLPPGFNEDINRNIIKSAINDNFTPSVSEEEQNLNHNDVSIPPLPPAQPVEKAPTPMVVLTEPVVPAFKQNIPIMDVPDSIFVRIDKFKGAKKEIMDIKRNLLEVEALINKVREIKLKEDNEVEGINLSLDSIKRKIEEIDSLVFNKI
jgi:hypothetical protein